MHETEAVRCVQAKACCFCADRVSVRARVFLHLCGCTVMLKELVAVVCTGLVSKYSSPLHLTHCIHRKCQTHPCFFIFLQTSSPIIWLD